MKTTEKTIDKTVITTAVAAVRLVPSCSPQGSRGHARIARPVVEHAVVPVMDASWGRFRLDGDATGYAGTSAWSPPT